MFDDLFGRVTVQQLNKHERNSAVNYATILILLSESELVTIDDIEHARARAEKMVDQAIKERLQQYGFDE